MSKKSKKQESKLTNLSPSLSSEIVLDTFQDESSISLDNRCVKRFYKIITSASIDTFQNEVEKYLNDGWELSGGVSTAIYADSYSGTTVYTQAIFK